ncbi:MAG: type II secretion system protein GspD [Sedimentisphaerales bacterium]|nr:type II secretion system protein GspD [Sedimentisphaerales bacterium]
MAKPNQIRRTVCFIMVFWCLCGGLAQSQDAGERPGSDSVEGQSKEPVIGRENPFAKAMEKKRLSAAPLASVAPVLSSPVAVEKPRPPLTMATVVLKFLDADKLKPAIEKMSSQYGSISIDPENNSLMICDTKEDVENILREVKKADVAPQQIMVEVVIADVQLNDDTEIGVNWDILSDKDYDVAYRQNFTSRLGSTIASATNIGNATAYNTTGTGGNFSIISGTIRNVLTLLQQKKEIEILASPRVMVVSGKTASIKAVEELPYNEIVNTSAGGSMSNTEFKEVGITLEVSATVTDDEHIHITIEATQNVATGESATSVPVIDTRNAKTELLLKDGQVVVMGGLRRKETQKQVNQVPILGDLPLIGFLFRNTDTVQKNSELMVFLSPRVYKGEPVSEDAMAKYKKIVEAPVLTLSPAKEKRSRKAAGKSSKEK